MPLHVAKGSSLSTLSPSHELYSVQSTSSDLQLDASSRIKANQSTSMLSRQFVNRVSAIPKKIRKRTRSWNVLQVSRTKVRGYATFSNTPRQGSPPQCARAQGLPSTGSVSQNRPGKLQLTTSKRGKVRDETLGYMHSGTIIYISVQPYFSPNSALVQPCSSKSTAYGDAVLTCGFLYLYWT